MSIDESTPPTVPVVVSPDVSPRATTVTTGGPSVPAERVILVPMSEWKQCAQRGVRSFMQALVYTIPLGVTAYLSGLGIPDAALVNLPSTHTPILDAILYSLVFGLVVFLWNFVEFWLDVDIKAPKWRA
jgi:hypothetical protein